MDKAKEKAIALHKLNNNEFQEAPIIRITKVELNDFKSVRFGEISIDSHRKTINNDSDVISSDILALYGQNGTGKSTFIDALSVLKNAISGTFPTIPYLYFDDNTAIPELTYHFEIYYDDIYMIHVVYSLQLDFSQNESPDDANNITEAMYYHFLPAKSMIIGECIQMALYKYTESKKQFDCISKLQPIIDTSLRDEDVPFGPASKRNLFFQNKDEAKKQLIYVSASIISGKSYIFDCFLEQMNSKDNEKLVQCGAIISVLNQLKKFGKQYLVVATNFMHVSNMIGPILGIYADNRMANEDEGSDPNTTQNDKGYDFAQTSAVDNFCKAPTQKVKFYKSFYANVTRVLETVLPNFQLIVEEQSDDANPETTYIRVMAVQDGIKLPLTATSAGIKKLISIIVSLVLVYNNPRYTVIVDELDASIFEYVLCELLESIEKHGQGQLMFTSHNLRLLEILDKKSLYFTTTNPDQRYIQLKGIASTNNVRKIYLRSIKHLMKQDEELYDYSSRAKLENALFMAGYSMENDEM